MEIGILIPTTQLDRASGMEVLNGTSIALANAQNLHGHPITLIKEDTSCLAVDLPRLVPRLTSRTNLVGIIGPVCEAESDIFTTALSDAGKTIISPTFIKIPSLPGSIQIAPSTESQSQVTTSSAPHRSGRQTRDRSTTKPSPLRAHERHRATDACKYCSLCVPALLAQVVPLPLKEL